MHEFLCVKLKLAQRELFLYTFLRECTEQAMIITARSNFTMIYDHLNTGILAPLSLLFVHTEHGTHISDYLLFVF